MPVSEPAKGAKSLTGRRWEAFGLAGQEVATFCRSGTVIYAGTNQGVFRRDLEPSRDGGWAPVPGSIQIPGRLWVDALVRDPYTTGTLYAGVGFFFFGGVDIPDPIDPPCLKSTDGGASWRPITDGLTGRYVFALAPIAGAPGQLLLSAGQDIFRTYDGGRSWQFMANLHGVGNPAFCAATHPTSTTIALLGSMDSHGCPSFYRSYDTGATWEGITGFNYMAYSLFGGGFSIVMDPRDEHVFYASAARCVYKRVTRGASDEMWLYDSGLGKIFALLVHPDDSQLVFAAGQDGPQWRLGFSFSTDAGVTWTTVTPPVGSSRAWCLAVDPANPHAILAGTVGGGVYRLTWDGPAQHALYAEPDAGGAVNKSIDRTYFDPGTTVTLTAAPGPHSEFVQWYGDVGPTTATATSAQNPLVLTMDRTRVVRARFAPQRHAVTATAALGGTAGCSPAGPLYDWGTTVTLAARPSFGARFRLWTGDVPPGRARDNPLAFTVDTTRTLNAQFGPDATNWWLVR